MVHRIEEEARASGMVRLFASVSLATKGTFEAAGSGVVR